MKPITRSILSLEEYQTGIASGSIEIKKLFRCPKCNAEYLFHADSSSWMCKPCDQVMDFVRYVTAQNEDLIVDINASIEVRYELALKRIKQLERESHPDTPYL